MQHTHKVEQIAYYDDLPQDEAMSFLATEAADKFRDALGWIVASGDKRANVAARAATIGYLFGYHTINEAAEMGNCSPRMITKLKTQLCAVMGIKKEYKQPIRRKEL